MDEPINNEAIKERLKELKRKKLELLKQQAAYQQDNLIEFFNNPERPLISGNFLVPNPKQSQLIEAFKSQRYRVFTYTGANRCLHGDTLIYDPVNTVSRPIKEIDSDFHVLSWDGEELVAARALQPFMTGTDEFCRVELDSGNAFEASEGHELLTENGYVKVSEIEIGSKLVTGARIKSVEKCGTRDRWDIHVPLYNNYYAQGAVHKNCGKTTIWAIIAICCMAGKWLWSGEPIRFSHNKPRKIRVIGQGWSSHIKTVVVPELWKWWPKNRPLVGGKPKKNNDGVEYFWEDAITGSTLEIMSNKQESEMFEGWSGDACIEENQRVLMSDGTWKPIKDVIVGDEVWTVNSCNLRSKNTVSRVINRGVRDIIKVNLVGGKTILCTPDHEIYVRNPECVNNDCRSIKVEAKDSVGHRAYCPLVNTDPGAADDFFNVFDGLPFILGAFIGDGWSHVSGVNGDNNYVFFASGDGCVVEYFNECLPGHYKLVHRKKYDYALLPNNGLIGSFISSLGLIGKKAHEKFIPQQVFKLSKKNKLEFIRGLLATDGWVVDGGIGYASTSERLTRDFGLLLDSLNISSTIQFKKSQKEGVWRDQWFLCLNKSASVIRFFNEIKYVPGKDIAKAFRRAKLAYLNNIARTVKHNGGMANEDFRVCEKTFRRSVQYKRVKSVVPAGTARVYDLTVETNHNFICEGILVSNCVYDEPPRRDIRVAAARGLIDRGGFELYACTLLKEAWVAQEIIKARLPDGRPDPSVYNVHATIEDNIGYGITRENVDQFAKMLTEDEKDARLRGVPSYMSGLVYPQFQRDIHLKPRFRVPLDWPVDIAIDTHPRKPHSVLFMATSPRGFKYCIHEIREHGDGKSIAESVVRLVQWGVYRVNKVIIDPLSKGDSNETDTTFEKASDVFARHGMYLETASKNKDAGILSVKEYLKSENNEASLFFFDDLVYTIKEIEGLMWEVDPNSEKEKAQKVDDDMMEDLYRLILLGTEYTRAVEAEEDEVPVVSGVNKVTGY